MEVWEDSVGEVVLGKRGESPSSARRSLLIAFAWAWKGQAVRYFR